MSLLGVCRVVCRYNNNSRVILRCMSTTSVTDREVDKDNKYDIIVAGGGMVGCTLACALAKNAKLSSTKILLLEGSPPQKFSLSPQHSNRVSALNPSTKRLLSSIGVWKHIEDMRLQPVKNMQVWDACSDAVITFNEDDYRGDVAYIVENDVLQSAVNQELNSSDIPNEVNVVHNAKIKDYQLPESDGQESLVKMENGDLYSCTLLLGADGINSKVRQKMGIQYMSWKYGQMGIVGTLELREEAENTTAWQRFLPGGPVALLPLSSKYSSLVWTVPESEAKKLVNLDPEEFLQALTHALQADFPRNSIVESAMGVVRNIVGGVRGPRQLPPPLASVTGRAAFPLGFGHASRYVSHGVALVGDSAHRVHPLAGQGVNLGFGDIALLVNILADAVYSGTALGDKNQLLEFESKRQRYVFPTAAAIDGLQKLYSQKNTLTVLLRSVGLHLTDSINPLKKAIMNHAKGY